MHLLLLLGVLLLLRVAGEGFWWLAAVGLQVVAVVWQV